MAKGQKTGGRKKGTPNKATATIKELALAHAPDAIQTLADIMNDSESDPSRVAAARELLDRAVGKPAQEITGKDGAPLLSLEALVAAALKKPDEL